MRPTSIELWIAWRYLRSRKDSKLMSFISGISIAGVVVGVAALIVVMGVMTGLQRDLQQKLSLGTPDIRVLDAKGEMRIDDWQRVLKTVEEQPGVAAVEPFVSTQCLAKGKGSFTTGAYIMGLPPQASRAPAVTDIRSRVVSGNFRFASSDGRARGIALGKLIAANLGMFVGDTVTLYCTGKGMSASGIPAPLVMQLEVAGVFESGMYEFDSAYLYLPLVIAQELAGLDSAVTGIEVKTDNRDDVKLTGAGIAAALGADFRTVDWQEQNRSLFQALNLEKFGMGLILLLIVLVAAFNIVSTLTMVVSEKRREIGILKAMGLRSASVRRVFLTQGLVIGVIGTVAGVIVGIATSLALGKYEVIKLDPEVYSIDHLPVATELSDVLVTIVASILIATVATLYPSMQASRLYPIEAIRHD